MLKQQLLVIYQTYNDLPELLKDPAIKKGYNALLSVSDNENFLQWQLLIEELGLSFANPNGINRRQNVLGELDDIATKANYMTILEFLCWKKTFMPCDWEFQHERNYELAKRIYDTANRNFDVHILLIKCGKQWVAIGEDADRLFEIFGWQTSAVYDGSKDISYIYISGYGLDVLRESKYSIHYLHPEKEIEIDKVFFSDSFTEDMIASYQQHIDYLRLQYRLMNCQRKFMTGMHSFVVPKLGYTALVNSNLTISDDEVVANLTNGSEVTIAKGNCWRLDDLGGAYLISLGSKLGEV